MYARHTVRMSERILATDIWEDYRPTPLIELPALARLANVGRVYVKVEGERPLGSFKALGGMTAGLRALARAAGVASVRELASDRVRKQSLPRLICASDGNHGLAVTAAARRAGAKASIFLPTAVSRARAARIESLGGEIVWVHGTYDEAVDQAAAAAARGEGLLIPDTSSDPADVVVRDVMTGYGLLAQELVTQFRDEVRDRPSHVFVQAGVGGLAAAMADGVRSAMQAPAQLVVVEPEAVACVTKALAAGRPVLVAGDLHTAAEMLSCGLASAAALDVLRRHEPICVTVSEGELQCAVTTLRDANGPPTTPSGAAGLAGLLHASVRPELRRSCQLSADSSVLLIATEGAVTE